MANDKRDNDDKTAGDDKTVSIVVNGRLRTVPKNAELSYEELVRLAFDNPPTGDDVQFTIQFMRGNGNKPAGTLVEGQTVKVKDGMEFDVTATNRS